MTDPAPQPGPGETTDVPAPAATPVRGWRDRVQRGLRRHEEERDVEDEPPPVTRLGRYELLRELGRGGMGSVHEARDTQLERRVAIKLLRDERRSPQARERFQVEARAAARLRHPHIVGLLEVGAEGEQQYQVMELIAGESLAARISRQGPLAPREAARVAAEVADALACAHAHAILHRDVKPANVLLEEGGRALLTDFGLAKEVERAGAGPTETGQTMGTPAYMSPEQVRGDMERVDRRADVYSLGATLFEALTGQPPFVGPNVPATLRLVLEKEPPLAGRLRAGIDRDLETICLRCLEKEPERRYGTAAELGHDLRRWLNDEPIAARRPGGLERAGKWLRRNRAVARALTASGALALLVIVAGAGLFLQRLRRERDRSDRAAREAREALQLLVREVQDELSDVPGARVRAARQRLLGLAAERLERLSAQGATPGDELDRAEAHRQIARLQVEAGDTRAAEASARQALAVSRPLAAARPDDVRAQRSLIASLQALTSLANRRGDGASALPLCEEALVLARRVDRDLRDSLSAPGLAICLVELARAQLLLGRDEAGERALEEALALRRALPAGQERLHAVADTTERLGNVRAERGDPSAIELLEETVAARRELCALAPTDAERTWQLAGCLISLGHARQRRGDASGAADAQEEALTLARGLYEQDRTSARQQQLLATGLMGAGNMREARGELASAREVYASGVELLRALRAQDPDDPAALDRLATALSRESIVLSLQGELPGALARQTESVALQRESVAAVGSGNPEARQNLATSLVDLGDLHAAAGQPAPARASCEEGLRLLRGLLAERPGNLELRLQLVRALNMAGALGRRAGEPAPAQVALHTEALQAARAALADVPESLRARRYLAHALVYLGELASTPEEAEPRYREALQLQRDALQLDAQQAGERRNLTVTLQRLGDLLKARGDDQGARACFEEAVSHQRLLAERDPTNADAQRNLLIMLGALADARRRAGDQAGASQVYEEVAARTPAGPDQVPPREATMALVTKAHEAFERGDMRGAGELYDQALTQARRRLAADARSLSHRRDLALILLRISDVRTNSGDVEGSLALTEEAVRVHRPLVDADPGRYQREHEQLLEMLERDQHDLALARGEVAPDGPQEALELAYTLDDRGEYARAAAQFRAAFEDQRLRGELSPPHLYNAAKAAACAAVTAAEPAARKGLLEQALGWLLEDLRRRRELMDALAEQPPSPTRDARLDAERAIWTRHVEGARTQEDKLAALRALPGFAQRLADLSRPEPAPR